MFTGRLPIRAGVYTDLGWPFDNIFRVFFPSSIGGLPTNETTIAELLLEDGYSTAMVHCPNPITL
jgi:arylsulfatase A-like enzyme